jgi:hypothetical protein
MWCCRLHLVPTTLLVHMHLPSPLSQSCNTSTFSPSPPPPSPPCSKFNHPEPALPTVQYSAQQGSYVPVRPLQAMPGMPQPYFYTYPAPQAAAGPALYPVAQPGAMAGHLGAPMAAAMPAPGLMYPGPSMAAAGMGMRQPGMQGMAPIGIDQLTSGLGGLRLQGGQQQMGRR